MSTLSIDFYFHLEIPRTTYSELNDRYQTSSPFFPAVNQTTSSFYLYYKQ